MSTKTVAKKPAPKKLADRRWSLTEARRNVHLVECQFEGRKSEQWALLLSDLHWDNPHCDRKLLKKHLDQAVERDAPILLVGDTFCAMQGKFDKRSDKSDVRPEHQTGTYLDSLVSTAAEWFEPYKNHIIVAGSGNHESAVRARHEIDLVDRFTTSLRQKGGITCTGGYSGYLRFSVKRGNCSVNSCTLWYHHGFGGGGPVTQGKIDWNRYGSYVDADILVAGHVHYKEAFPSMKVSLNNAGEIEQRTIYCIRLGTYKEEFQDGFGGFHIEKGRGPRPLGGYWLNLHMEGDTLGWKPHECD